MDTLSSGLKRPAAGDKGSVFWDAMKDNVTWMDTHTHNGETGDFLDSSQAPGVAGTALAAVDWVLVGNGIYRQLVTMPNITGSSPAAAMNIDSFKPVFRFSGGSYAGEETPLKILKVSASTYYVYINDNTQALTVVYT